MTLESRIKKLEEKYGPQAEITIKARGNKFSLDGEEITAEELRELSTRYQQIVVTGYLDDAGFQLLESLNCDIEVRGKYYIGFDPNCWDKKETEPTT